MRRVSGDGLNTFFVSSFDCAQEWALSSFHLFFSSAAILGRSVKTLIVDEPLPYYTVSVNSKKISIALAFAFLSACKSAEPPTISTVSGARSAVFFTSQLLSAGFLKSGGSRPAAAIGVIASHFLLDVSAAGVAAARAGVESVVSLLLQNQVSTDLSFTMLRQLGVVLEIDVRDMLNRSIDRTHALDAYTANLQAVINRSTAQVTALKQQDDTLLKDLHQKRGIVADVQHELNTSLRDQDYTTASAKQSQIIEAQGEVAKIDTEERQVRSLIGTFKDLIKIGSERLSAIRANREVLIAGLHVENVPGIDDLGILKDKYHRNSGNRSGYFQF